MWFVEDGNDASGGSSIKVVKLTNPFSSSTASTTTTALTVTSYGNTTIPRQTGGTLGSGTNLGTRFYFSGLRTISGVTHLVSADTVGNGTGDSVEWYDLNVSSGTPVLTQQGRINPNATTTDTYFPDVDVAPDGTIGMDYSESGTSELMSMYITGHRPTDSSGVVATPVLAKTSTVVLDARGRAGDYSFTSVDPADGTFWAVNEYAINVTSPNWATWIQHFDVTPPSAPSTPDLLAADDKGSSSTDNNTNVRTPRFTGTAEPGSTVTLFDGSSTMIGSAIAASDGTWNITASALTNGSHSIKAHATDAAGNTSSDSSSLTVMIHLFGDVNQDNHVDSADIVALETALSSLSSYETAHGLTAEDMLLIGDVDQNGSVTNADVQALEDFLIDGNGY